jgi:hypothetical protein
MNTVTMHRIYLLQQRLTNDEVLAVATSIQLVKCTVLEFGNDGVDATLTGTPQSNQAVLHRV